MWHKELNEPSFKLEGQLLKLYSTKLVQSVTLSMAHLIRRFTGLALTWGSKASNSFRGVSPRTPLSHSLAITPAYSVLFSA